MSERYCPAWGPGSPVCSRSICDCFIDQFPDDMEQAGALHPEFFTVVTPPPVVHAGHCRRNLAHLFPNYGETCTCGAEPPPTHEGRPF